MESETNQKPSSYRKIKQRQNFSNSPYHHHHQQQQRIRIHQENRSRNWYQKTKSEQQQQNQQTKQNEQSIPAVKILAKSNKPSVTSSSSNDTNNQNQDIDTNSNTTVNVVKPRPSVSFLEKNIQPLLKIHQSRNNVQSETTTTTAASNKQPKYIKIVDFEFNFTIQPDTLSWSILDSWLLPDSNVSTTSNNSTSTPSASVPSSSSSTNITQGFGSQSFSIVAAVGLDGVGKSSLLNSMAQCDVFETRKMMAMKNHENPLNHITNGIDMHITAERVFLLDTQVTQTEKNSNFV